MDGTTSGEFQEIVADLHMRIALQEVFLSQVVLRLAAMQKRPDDLLGPVMNDMAVALHMAVEAADDEEARTEAKRAAACFRGFQERLRAAMTGTPLNDAMASH